MSKLKMRYTKEEKLQIVKESMEDGVRVEDLAKSYSIHPNTLRRWRSEFTAHKSAAFPGKGNETLTEEQRETQLLRKQLRESELANEILKKALGIISSPNRRNLHL